MLFKVDVIQSWPQKLKVQGFLVPCTKGPQCRFSFSSSNCCSWSLPLGTSSHYRSSSIPVKTELTLQKTPQVIPKSKNEEFCEL